MSYCYEDFGAVGDGIHDDFEAIIKCHDGANLTGTQVKAKDEGVYYIGGSSAFATIKTDVDWGKATFIIDDSNVENRRSPIFLVKTDSEIDSMEISGPITKDTKRIPNNQGRPVYVRVFSEDKKRFIRKGLNQDSGVNQNDCFLLDSTGAILTDIDWEYENITLVKAFCTDDRPITLQGGVFKTKVNQEASFYNYYRRGIDIHRSNVTVENVTHYVSGETDHGAPYEGFIYIDECADVTIRSCLLTPHFTYWTDSKIPGEKVPMGSYDIRANAVIGLVLDGLTQTIDINIKEYWGLMCSNFCKDMTLKNCVISRYDAHMGVTNLNISGCTFGHVGINLIGHGEVTIENCKAYGNYFVGLREDYGSNFDGKLIIKGCFWKPSSVYNNELIRARNSGDHDFGYECHMTSELVIDDFLIDDEGMENVYIFPAYDEGGLETKPFPYHMPQKFDIKNVRTTGGKEVILYKNGVV